MKVEAEAVWFLLGRGWTLRRRSSVRRFPSVGGEGVVVGGGWRWIGEGEAGGRGGELLNY